jgi:D-alanine-D-alanine ligase
MKKVIAIFAGGDSGEHDISVRSASVVMQHLDKGLFEIYHVLIKGPEWTCRDLSGNPVTLRKDDLAIMTPGGNRKIDAVFMAIHGTPGEDGKLQGYLDLLGIPYTSCDQATSALTFNKYFCNRFVSALGIKTAPSLLIHRHIEMNPKDIVSKLSLPVFVKPNRGGSSVGTSRVDKIGDLAGAVSLAFREDDQALIEASITGREVTCGVISYRGAVLSLPLTEIVSQNAFFDFEAKYEGRSEEITPADVPGEIEKECRRQSEMIFRELNCKGMVRIDYIFNSEGLWFLEVNTVPGLSEASIVPQQAAAAGISLRDLFTETVLGALKTR